MKPSSMMSFKIYKTKSSMSIKNNEIHSLNVNYGCDGSRHALDIIEEYKDDQGNTINAHHVGDVVVGRCDESCKCAENLGGFILDWEI